MSKHFSDHAMQRYSRHLLMADFGFAGQEKLSQSVALVVGMGGLGCPAATYLALGGIGKIIVVDPDRVELSNLQRQMLYTEEDIGTFKVVAAEARLRTINPEVAIQPHAIFANAENLPAILAEADIVLDCTDRFAIRHLINRAVMLAGKPLVIASALRWDGQLMVVSPQDKASPCYECVFPEHLGAQELSCSQMGVFSPLTGVMGAMQALEAMKYVLGLPVNTRQLILFSARDGRFHHLNTKVSAECPLHIPRELTNTNASLPRD